VLPKTLIGMMEGQTIADALPMHCRCALTPCPLEAKRMRTVALLEGHGIRCLEHGGAFNQLLLAAPRSGMGMPAREPADRDQRGAADCTIEASSAS
jgi:hypothetical protein